MNMVQTLNALAVALVCVCGVVGCGREEPPAAPEASTAPVSPLDDPKFVRKMDAQDGAQRQIMKKYAEIKAAYDAAYARDPDSIDTKQLKARLSDLEQKFMENRQKTAQLVGEQLRKQANEQKK